MIKKILIYLSLVVIVQGCSNKSIYESLQTDNYDCRKLPTQHRSECYKNVEGLMTYDKYNEEIKKL